MLIVVRGNSGSGKSTVAAALQRELGWPTAVLGQDHFRRVVPFVDERRIGPGETVDEITRRILADG